MNGHVRTVGAELRAAPALLLQPGRPPAKRSAGPGRFQHSTQVVARASSKTGTLFNFGAATRHLYSEVNSKIQEYAQPFQDVEASLDLISEASVDLEALQMTAEPLTALKLVRLAEFVQPEEWVRPLNEWLPPPFPERSDEMSLSRLAGLEKAHAEEQFESLVRHLLLRYDDAPRALLHCFTPFHGLAPAQHWARAESPFLSEDNWLLSYRFARVLVAVGAGQSATKALKEYISPKITKQIGHAFMQTPDDVDSPVRALRAAQVAGLGGSPALSREACGSTLGFTLGSDKEEEFVHSMLLWMCEHEEELSQVKPSSVMDHLMASYESSRLAGKPFSMKGKTVNSVLKTTQGVFELFYPSGFDSLTFEGKDAKGAPCKVSVEEVGSADGLLEVGQAMANCLRTQRGIYKYTLRARNRSSSFWVVSYSSAEASAEESTKNDETCPFTDKDCQLVFEVWNQSRIVHQAEGPGSSFPSQHAIDNMQIWAESQGVDWTTW
eukprot:CAMPEP_0117683826 /NCGR_PEP_ID=MMETSP0804-20121206/20669_1 /TAXON_ID=1074897 /ORGANISM="Tetraselmis astigmatica, Strain CCMP880" /LENGTH=494 /DNA_ID=CAMNT_0005494569 /DNA_START=169 /DNA_END=1650 /DNA_ORIENTATION=-